MAYGSLALDEISTSGNLAITGDTTVVGNLSASNMSGRNRIINGQMMIDQRNAGASQTVTAAAALAYTVDRWYAYCTGANVTGQRVTGPGNNLFAYRFTGAAGATAIGFGQRIEAQNSADLAGSTAMLSVDLANTLLTTVTWTAFYANTTDTFGTLASPTRTQIAIGTFTVNSTLTRYSTPIAIPSAATTGIEIVFTVGAQTSGTWTIDNVQLEPGTVATPFERRMIGTELTLCQRYLYKILTDADAFLSVGVWFNTNSGFFSGQMPQVMRVVPTLTLEAAASSYKTYNVGAGTYTALSTLVLNGVTSRSFYLLQFVSSASPGGQGQTTYLSNNGAAGTLGFQLVAEL
jgi:hypothetical protein